jgi:hypothetical protein
LSPASTLAAISSGALTVAAGCPASAVCRTCSRCGSRALPPPGRTTDQYRAAAPGGASLRP